MQQLAAAAAVLGASTTDVEVAAWLLAFNASSGTMLRTCTQAVCLRAANVVDCWAAVASNSRRSWFAG